MFYKTAHARWLIIVTGLAVASGAADRAAAESKPKDKPPDLSGNWAQVADKTDDASKALEVFSPPHGARGDDGTDSAGGGRGGGMGGRPGGWGGGGGGRGGWGGGGRPGGWGGPGGGRGWAGPHGDFAPPTPEERAAMHAALREALEAPASLKIAQTDAGITLRRPDGLERHLATDGKKAEVLRVTRTARWKGDKLVIETKVRRAKITETFSLGPEAGQLSVDVRAEDPRFGGQLTLKRLYSTAPDAPAVSAPPAATPSGIRPPSEPSRSEPKAPSQP
jgi:hypothetical protein